MSRALAHGRRAALASIAGNSTGSVVPVLLVAFGLGSVVATSLLVFTVVKLIGAAYLGYLGVRTYRERGELAEAMSAAVPGEARRSVYRQGIAVGLTNPKALVFFAAVLPQFVNPHEGSVPVQMDRAGVGVRGAGDGAGLCPGGWVPGWPGAGWRARLDGWPRSAVRAA